MASTSAEPVRLRELVVDNFKSYKGEQIIGPFKDFTAIIGPNGAGKSNLMDAVSFVLGVQARHLRGNQLKDLLFRGDGSRPAARATVTAVFEHGANGSNVTKFSRSVNSDGKSDYRINGRSVSWDAYDKALQKWGILVKARNFLVFQGDVESVASKSPKELTALLEQVSRSDELKSEYDELRAAKERAEENTIFNFQKKRGIAAERKQYKEQKEEADRFQRLVLDKRSKTRQYFLWQLHHIEVVMREHEEKLEELNGQMSSLVEEQEEIDGKLRAEKKEHARLTRTVLQKEKDVKKCEKELDRQRPLGIKLQENMKHVTRKLETHRKSMEKVKADYEKQQEKLRALKAEMSSVEEAERAFRDAMDEDGAGKLQLAEKQVAEYNRLKEEAGRRSFALRQDLEKAKRTLKVNSSDRETTSAKVDELVTAEEQLKETVAQLEERHAKVSAAVSEHVDKLSRLQTELEDVVSNAKQYAQRYAELTALREEAEEKLRDARADRRQSEKEARMAESLEALQRLIPGVHGRLVDLCKPTQRRFHTALTVALGKNMDAIVVDTEKTAVECIAYMREQRVGVCTFIPLDTIRTKPVNERLRRLGGTAKLVQDVLDFSPRVARAFQYACGNTVVCDELNEAKRIAYEEGERVKVVTLDGTVISKAGFITGGISGVDSRSQRWDEKAMESVRRDRDRFERELAELTHSRRSEAREQKLRSDISGEQDRIRYFKLDLENTNERLQGAKKDLSNVSKGLNKLRPQLGRLERSISPLQEQVSSLEENIGSVEDEVFAEFSRSVGVESIREFEAKQLRNAHEKAEKSMQFTTQIANLRNQIEYEESRDFAQPMENLQRSIDVDRKQLEKIRDELAQCTSDAEKSERVLEGKRAEAAVAREEADKKAEEMKSAKNKVSELTKQIGTIKKKVTAQETEIEQSRNRRHDVLMRCRVEEVDLPLLDGEELDDTGGDSMDIETEPESQAARRQNEREAKMSMRVDFSALAREYRKKLSAQAYESMEEKFQEEIQQITLEMAKLAPNLRANERLEDVNARLEDLLQEFEEARKNAKKATEKFLAVKEERMNRFMAAFEHISKEIDTIYKALTRSRSFPAGGNAYLTLENTDEPFEHGIKYTAMPPMKRFREIEQLSGGEKTVAALSLLFAIHSFQPSPFFVLDEVDAALDASNVMQVARFLRSKKENVQIIVISLKDTLYDKADALAGVYREQDEGCSKTLTLDLREYD